MIVEIDDGSLGTIVGPFGTGGKFRAKFPAGIRVAVGSSLIVNFKRFVHDKSKSMLQTNFPELPLPPPPDVSSTVDGVGLKAAVDKKKVKKSKSDISSGGSGSSEKKEDITKAHVPEEKATATATATASGEMMTIQFNGNNTAANTGGKGSGETKDPDDITLTAKPAASKSSSAKTKKTAEKKSNTSLASPVNSTDTASDMRIGQVASTSSLQSLSPTPTSVIPPVTTSLFGEGAVTRRGKIESMKASTEASTDSNTPQAIIAIVTGAFRMEENIRLYVGSQVLGCNKSVGSLTGPFAKMGKCKISFPNGCAEMIGGEVEVLLKQP